MKIFRRIKDMIPEEIYNRPLPKNAELTFDWYTFNNKVFFRKSRIRISNFETQPFEESYSKEFGYQVQGQPIEEPQIEKEQKTEQIFRNKRDIQV